MLPPFNRGQEGGTLMWSNCILCVWSVLFSVEYVSLHHDRPTLAAGLDQRQRFPESMGRHWLPLVAGLRERWGCLRIGGP